MGKHNNVTFRNKQKNFTYLSVYIYYLDCLDPPESEGRFVGLVIFSIPVLASATLAASTGPSTQAEPEWSSTFPRSSLGEAILFND